MSDTERLELIEQLAHALRTAKFGDSGQLAPAQKQRLVESVRRISALRTESPGGFSGRGRDQVLCGPSARPD